MVSFKLISYSATFSNLLPLVFFIFLKRNKEKTLRVIFLYVVYCCLNEVFVYLFHENNIKNDFIFLALFTVFEFSFFCLFYYYALPIALIKKGLPVIWGLFVIFACLDFFLVNEMNNFDSFASGVESIIIILLCIYYLTVQIKGANNLSIYSTSNFWIIIAFLIYLSGTFFLYIMAENMITKGDLVKTRAFRIQYIIINSAFYILKNVLLSVAMLMKPTPKSNQDQKNKDWDDLLSYRLNNEKI